MILRAYLSWFLSSFAYGFGTGYSNGLQEVEQKVRTPVSGFSTESSCFAARFHPDKNKDKSAEEKFVEIAHGMMSFILYTITSDCILAYEVLSDPTVRLLPLSWDVPTNSCSRNDKSMIAMARSVNPALT